MIIFSTKNFTIYCGTQATGFAPQQFYTISTQRELCAQKPFASLQLKNLITVAQTHSIDGYHVTQEFSHTYRPYSLAGDYLITSQPRVALGVATADCLPMVFFDSQNYALAVIHAGWRGSAQSIAGKVLTHMQQTFNTDTKNLLVFFGPGGRSCCYEIQPDFLAHFPSNSQALVHRNNKLFFDTSTYNKELLIQKGVLAQNINQQYNQCTICDVRFCSYRRDGARALRQMTIAYLH